MLKVILHQRQQIDHLNDAIDNVGNQADALIADSEDLLKSLGKKLPARPRKIKEKPQVITLRSWEEIEQEAEDKIHYEVAITDLLSVQETESVKTTVLQLETQFNLSHKLDLLDWGIAGLSGVVAALTDIFLVKMPSYPGMLGGTGAKGGALSDFFRNSLKKMYAPEQIKDLEKAFSVPYDASVSTKLNQAVSGLSPRSHRFQSLGHDPVLGFIFGVRDIMCGEMTAIDKAGKLIVQKIPGAPDGLGLFRAFATQIGHLKSDVATAAGLPAPFMPLLQLLQVGSFGKNNRTIGELSRIMYRQGYDFGHFLAMSVPVMMIETMVRSLYFAKRRSEGFSITESLPLNLPGQPRKPKLQTMLFTAHAIATAVNAGKVAITENPLTLNLSQWLWFAQSSFRQVNWIAFQKPKERFDFVQNQLDVDWEQMNRQLLEEFPVKRR